MDKVIAKLMEERTPLVQQCTLVEPPKDDEPDGPTKVTFCSRADGNFCSAYAWPAKKWINFDCPLADNFLKTETETEDIKKINPLKASKRARKK